MEIAPKDMKFNGVELFIKLVDGQTVSWPIKPCVMNSWIW